MPQARIHPRMAGTRAHAVVGHRLLGAIRLSDGCATANDGSTTDARRLSDG